MTVIFIECALHGSQLLQALQSFLVFESFLVAASDLPTSRGKQKKPPVSLWKKWVWCKSQPHITSFGFAKFWLESEFWAEWLALILYQPNQAQHVHFTVFWGHCWLMYWSCMSHSHWTRQYTNQLSFCEPLLNYRLRSGRQLPTFYCR